METLFVFVMFGLCRSRNKLIIILPHNILMKYRFFLLLPFFIQFASHAELKSKPLNGLLVTGGGHHDYARTKGNPYQRIGEATPGKVGYSL